MRFRRRLSPEARVDLIPMIDVVFQLVIFFMVSSTFMLSPGISMVLPSSTTTEPVLMTELVVTISSQEEIYVNKDRHTLASFGPALENLTDDEKDEIDSVVIQGDRDISYEVMIKVLTPIGIGHGVSILATYFQVRCVDQQPGP